MSQSEAETTPTVLEREYDLGHTAGMKIAISVPDAVGQAADRVARRLGMARSQLYARAVLEFVRRAEGEDVTARLDAVYGNPKTPRDDAFAIEAGRRTLRRTSW